MVEFDERRIIAWRPSELGKTPPGHLWRWTLEPLDSSRTQVTHTHDWSELTDEGQFARARATTADMLQASLDRLAALTSGRTTGDGSRWEALRSQLANRTSSA